MHRLARRQRRRPAVRVLMRVAIFALCICLTAFSIAMSVEAVRVRFFEAVTRVFEDWTETSYTSEQLDPEDFVPMEPSYIPEGFEEVERIHLDPLNLNIIYQDENGHYIDYVHGYLDGTTFGYDSENAEVETVSVLGDDNATFVSKNGWNQLIWLGWNSHYSILSDLNKDEIIKIANSTKKTISENN